MDKCRICLTCSTNLVSLYDLYREQSYLDMVNFVAGRQIILDDQSLKICSRCKTKLEVAYDFKILIQRSQMDFYRNHNVKRINFSNLCDIKGEIDIKPEVKHLKDKYFMDLFNNKEKCISYRDVEIKKVSYSDEKGNKLLPVLDFLKSIKTESENDFDSDDYVRGYCMDSDADEYVPFKPVKKNKIKNKHTKESKKSVNSVCIKPVYLENVRVLYSDANDNRKTNTKKYKYPKKKMICPFCGKFVTQLKFHMLRHTAERSFKCEICAKTFYSDHYLKVHLKKHSAEKKFKCDLCVAAFKDRGSLKSHMASHSNERNFMCDVCSKGFKKKHALTRHIRIHFLGEKKIKCELCKMTFHENVSLRTHMRVHTGERPFNCEICSQPYSYKHDFNRHCLKKHGVFLKRRSVKVMNEEVLKRERLLMKRLLLRTQGIAQEDMPQNPFEGPQAALALDQALKAIASNLIPFDI